jgi:sugar phosphate isomerase/epimerase
VNRFAFDPDLEMQRLGFRLQPFEQWPLKNALEFLSKTGYKFVELNLDHPELQPAKITSKGISQIRSVLEEVGLTASAVSYLCKDKTIDTLSENLKSGLDLAFKIGAKVFILCAGPLCADPGGRNTRAALVEILNLAEECRIAVAVEPEPESTLHGLFEFSELARRLAGSPLRLNLNVAHTAITEGNLDEVIENWASYIVHVHLSDVRNREHAHLLPGDGHLDILSIVRKLREHNYDGNWTLDVTGQPGPPEQLAQQAIERCRSIFF